MRKILIAAAAATLFAGGAVAQATFSHTFTFTKHREDGLTAARNYINQANGLGPGDPGYYATNDAYAQHVMDGAGDSYCNNVPDANCAP